MTALLNLLETSTAQNLAAVQLQAPKGWRAGREMIGENAGTVTTAGTETPSAREDDLLISSGFDPDEWSIIHPIRHSTWQAQVKGGGVRDLTSYRFNVQRRAASAAGIDELIKAIGRKKAAPVPGKGTGTFNFANGDWQLGKIDGDGIEGTVDRIVASIDAGVAEFKKARRKDAAFVHLSFLGDCIEGFVSQGGGNAWRTQLTLTEQLRIMRRLYLYAIDGFAPLTERLTVVSVPGNHDEAVRHPGITTYDDSFATDGLIAVTDAMKLNTARYGHVETFVPQRDSLTVTLDVNGTIITHAHGHQWRNGKHWDWWKGQSFEPGSDIGQSTLLLSAHGHHFQLDTKGQRTYIMTPAQESESTWWKNKTGDHGAPGALVFITEAGKAKGFSVV